MSPSSAYRRGTFTACALALTVSAGVSADRKDSKATEGLVKREDLEIVECLLPGQVRQLGNSTYLTQRRPTRTTTSDCRIRGGEYVSYDRADYKSALRIWMPAAEAGDPDAQTNVAEIYERGIGGEPNYEAALIWYQKAADQGYARALFDLGTLYEVGQGVEKDRMKALNFYRRAWGLPEDSVMYTSAAAQQQEQLRAELQKAVAEKDQQLELLNRQLTQMQIDAQKQLDAQKRDAQKQLDAQKRKASAGAGGGGDSAKEIEALKSWIARLEAERRTSAGRLQALPSQTREPLARAPAPQLDPQAEARLVKGVDFGRFYALIIGNQDYQLLEHLQTPRTDAERAGQLLKDKYGFTVRVIEDANDVAMLRALNELNSVLRPNDNVLIYYAGHGARLVTANVNAGYWLPVNAERPPQDTFWVANEQVTAHVARLAARRVLVIADSCYAGLLSSEPSEIMFGNETRFSLDYVKYKLPKRARLVLSSGGDEPVLDTGGQGDSVFARAFLDVLAQNNGIMSTSSLFTQVQARIREGAARSHVTQAPELKAMKAAGHELGDFFFVPRGLGT